MVWKREFCGGSLSPAVWALAVSSASLEVVQRSLSLVIGRAGVSGYLSGGLLAHLGTACSSGRQGKAPLATI
eukprot:11543866-Prorocentrum_lima.AAC.1